MCKSEENFFEDIIWQIMIWGNLSCPQLSSMGWWELSRRSSTEAKYVGQVLFSPVSRLLLVLLPITCFQDDFTQQQPESSVFQSNRSHFHSSDCPLNCSHSKKHVKVKLCYIMAFFSGNTCYRSNGKVERNEVSPLRLTRKTSWHGLASEALLM